MQFKYLIALALATFTLASPLEARSGCCPGKGCVLCHPGQHVDCAQGVSIPREEQNV